MTKIQLKPEDFEVSPFDMADYLHDEKDISAYLNEVFADGDPALIASALGDVVRAKGMLKTAKAAKLNRGSLYTSLTKQGDPKISTVSKLIKSLGLSLTVTPTCSKTPRRLAVA
jgi:probable addiction module antidote protein